MNLSDIQIKSGWKVEKFGQVVSIIDGDRGKNYPKQGEFFDNEYCLFLNTKNVPNNVFDFSEKMFITQQKDSKLGKGKLIRNDYVLTTRGTLGNFAYYSEKIAYENIRLNSGMVILRTENNSSIENKYLGQFLNSPFFKNQVVSRSSGSAQPQLPIRDLSTFEIALPPLSEQKSIVKILSDYDDLIENNEKRIKILESMAQKLYTEWFVRFKFPGHEKVKMVDSDYPDFGMIPEGWKLKTFYEVVKNFDSKRKPISSMKRKEIQGIFPYYGAAKIIDYINAFIFNGRYLLIAEDGSVITKEGKPVLQFVDEKFWVSNHAHIIQGDLLSSEVIYLRMKDFNVSGLITGAAQPKITKENLGRVLFCVPDQKTKNMFDELVIPIFNQIFNLQKQNINLKKSRDILIPQLVSGKIEIK